MKLEGKSILVTGASRGIGRAVASFAAAEGARVFLHFSRSRRAAEDALASLPGEGHAIFQSDFTEAGAAESLASAVLAEHGCPDVLVNNAGIFEEHPPAEASFETWRELWDRTLAVNLLAPAQLAGPEGEAIRAQSPLGRAARPEEIARTVLFLAVEAPEYMTGAVVDVNGASYLRT